MPKRPGAPRRARGGQPRNANAATHRVYSAPAKPLLTLDDLIADLRQRISQLAGMLDSGQGELSPDQFITVAKLYGELASRLGRLLRDQPAGPPCARAGRAPPPPPISPPPQTWRGGCPPAGAASCAPSAPYILATV